MSVGEMNLFYPVKHIKVTPGIKKKTGTLYFALFVPQALDWVSHCGLYCLAAHGQHGYE